MTTTPTTEKHWNTARLALVTVWVACLGWMHFPTMTKTIEGFLNPKNEMMYGWFVVPVAFWMVMFLWKKLRVAAGCPAWGGLVLLVVSFVLLSLGQHTGRLSLCQLAMILSIPAVAWRWFYSTNVVIVYCHSKTTYIAFPGSVMDSLFHLIGYAMQTDGNTYYTRC
jgi:hypothetical protein